MTSALKPNTNEILKKEIDDRGIKTNFVADKVGVSANYLGQVLSGSRKLSDHLALKTIRFLGLSVDNFMQ